MVLVPRTPAEFSQSSAVAQATSAIRYARCRHRRRLASEDTGMDTPTPPDLQFQVNPSDLEAVLRGHDAVAEAAVVGVPSNAWGETPVAFVVRREDGSASADDLLEWVNARVGKTQRLASLRFLDELPRSAVGKVLKRELRYGWWRFSRRVG
jgi:hypothetical protein